MTSSTSTPRYVPPQRRSPTYRGQPYLTYEDLHTRYSPPNSPRIRMPQIQRSLSAEDLYRRFQKNQSENQKPQGQEQPDNTAYSPPPPLRNLEALRRRPPRVLEQTLRPILSPRLPDPPVFNDTDRSKFEDWKLRIQNKLLLNRDHYPTDAFQINYVISRLAEKANEHTISRRRKCTATPYNTAQDILNQLNDLYETPLHLLQEANAHICEELKQGAEQSFPEFYTKFMRYAADDQSQKRHLIRCLEGNITKRLREAHMMMSTGRD
ncbi:MAG: hypothetical protein ALECFALPRED_009557 [Alectoria fallacina]|uniref:Uncharacterized protein n=1 Tax=Alectoria fallacina TaxID=1903189 RepID=A0A8H3PJ85_9LECA|nr:MAG: hypothetical protein ALECFALPRED_009557 [Alectoria fallacina]